MRLAGTATALVIVAAAVSGCAGGGGGGGDATAPTAVPTVAPTSAPASEEPTSGAPAPLQAACSRYDASHDTARQVVSAAASPILASGPAFFLITLRQVATDAISTVPTSAAVFTELQAAIDDLNKQASAALPPGADGTKTLVTVQPARLAAALEATDRLCAGGK